MDCSSFFSEIEVTFYFGEKNYLVIIRVNCELTFTDSMSWSYVIGNIQ
jgi:hypothetical protein